MKKKLTLVLAALLTMTMVIGLAGCSSNNNTAKTEKLEPGSNGEIIMATTTSTQDSGLLDVLLPKFEEETGIAVKVVAVGTGKAIEMGKNGEADVLLVHAKSQEEDFVKEGYGIERFDVMYNDFIVLGSKDEGIDDVNCHEGSEAACCDDGIPVGAEQFADLVVGFLAEEGYNVHAPMEGQEEDKRQSRYRHDDFPSD